MQEEYRKNALQAKNKTSRRLIIIQCIELADLAINEKLDVQTFERLNA